MNTFIKHITILMFLVCINSMQTRAQQRITGGNSISIEDAPWQVQLLIDGSFCCGGSILSSEYILTAKHCFNNMPPDQLDIKIVAGSTSSTQYSPSNVYKVSDVVLHPTADAALLKLERPLTFSAGVMPVNCFSTENSDYYTVGRKASVTGWGWTYADAYRQAETLQRVEVTIISDEEASRALYNAGEPVINPSEMATKGSGPNRRGPCLGDSGGPLVTWSEKENSYVLIGIVYRGTKFCRGNNETSPAVYTKVSYILPWLHDYLLGDIELIGTSTICDEATYRVTGLPTGAKVTWSYEGMGIMPQPLIITKNSDESAVYKRGTQYTSDPTYPYNPPIQMGSGATPASLLPEEPYTGEKVITASINGTSVILKKPVKIGTVNKPEIRLNGRILSPGDILVPGKVGNLNTLSCTNIPAAYQYWEINCPGVGKRSYAGVSSVEVTPTAGGVLQATVWNTDGCPDDNSASLAYYINTLIQIDPINPVNPVGTIVASVWCEGAGDESGGTAVKAAAADGAGVEAEKVPYEGAYTVELWDDRAMLGRWQREGHVMEIPGTGTVAGKIYYLWLYVDGELADVAKVMVY